MKGVQTPMGTTTTPMHLTQLGTNTWVNTSSYPMVRRSTQYYLGPQGSLSPTPPPAAASDTIAFTQPSLPLGKLVYKTEPLPNGATIAGPISATFYASPDESTNLHLIAELDDIAPDGTVTKLTSGSQLASMRALDGEKTWTDDAGVVIKPYGTYLFDAYLTAGQVARLDVVVSPRVAAIEPGHSLQLAVTTQVDPTKCSVLLGVQPCFFTAPQLSSLPGTYHVRYGADTPSSINLPLLPAGCFTPSGGDGEEPVGLQGGTRAAGSPCDDATAPAATAYYFAEGTTLPGFREYLLLANPTPAPVTTDVVYYFDDGAAPLATRATIPASGRSTIDVESVPGVGPGRTGVSIAIPSASPVVAERSLYFAHDFAVGNVNGSHSALGAKGPRLSWVFAEGSTLPGFQEYLTLQNPGSTSSTVTVDYGLEGGGSRQSVIDVPAGQRRTIDVNTAIGAPVVGHSTRVTATSAVVAERSMYFLRPGINDDGSVTNGGHVSFGTAPAATWNFAEGNVLPDFAMYLTLANPDTSAAATADITYILSDSTTLKRTTAVAPGSRRTVRVFDTGDAAGIGRDVSDAVSRGVSVQVTTAAPGGIVVERPMYFDRAIDGQTVVNDGHDQPGVQNLAIAWGFAEGSTLPGFFPFLTISNPNPAAATLTILYTPDAGAPVTRTLVAPPTSRTTVQVYGPADQGGIGSEVTGFGMFVTSTQPVLVESPIYVSRPIPGLPLIDGGSTVVGDAR